MKKWSIMAMVMALLIAATVPISALAQSNEEVTSNSRPMTRDWLAIVAPRVVPVDTEISMTVFQCSNQEPVNGASVWLITKERLEVVRQEMAGIKGDTGLSADQEDYESLLSIHGTHIGNTGADGKLWYSFDSAGRYLFIAVMRGYFPDFRPITVGMLPRALVIDAPRRAEVGENVTIPVFQRGTEDPVKDAGVWAFTRENAESLKASISSLLESGNQEAINAAIEEACNIHGIFLGTTNGAGKVHYAFEEAGGYLLVARKHGYFPGWKLIGIFPEIETKASARPGLTGENQGIKPHLQ